MNQDHDAYDILAEVQRRLDRLETAPRIPQFSTSGGTAVSVQSAVSNVSPTSASAWVDLTSGAGPTGSVTVTESGKVLVVFGAQARVVSSSATGAELLGMGYELSNGGLTLAAGTSGYKSPYISHTTTATSGVVTNSTNTAICAAQIHTNLVAGLVEITAKYYCNTPANSFITFPWMWIQTL